MGRKGQTTGERKARRKGLLLLLHGKACPICGRPLDLSIRDKSALDYVTIEHVKAIARGGSRGSLDNQRLAHFGCNGRKGTDDAADHYRFDRYGNQLPDHDPLDLREVPDEPGDERAPPGRDGPDPDPSGPAPA